MIPTRMSDHCAPDILYPSNQGDQSCTNAQLEHRLLEVFDALWDDFVDPREAYADVDGSGGRRWAAMPGRRPASARRRRSTSSSSASCASSAAGWRRSNEFAINGHENRISYIVGPGHSYRATICKGMDASPDAGAGRCRKCSTEFVRENRWHERQQEIVRRIDRDGEAFLRFFVDHDGMTRVRFIEPDQVATPPELAADPSASFGIQTDPRRCGDGARLLRRRRVRRRRPTCSIAGRTSIST